MAISYDPKRWAYGNEFTPDIMNHIENGIKAATDEANRIDEAKVDKVSGKGLSTNDYTNAEKQKVSQAATAASVTELSATVTALTSDVDRHAFGSGSGGKNIWNEKWEVGMYNNSDGKKEVTDKTWRNTDFVPVESDTSYFITFPVVLYFYDANKGFIVADSNHRSPSAFTTPSTCKYINFRSYQDDGNEYRGNLAIIEGTSGQYEPYIASNAQLTEAVDESEVRDAELQALGWCVPSEMPIKNTLANGVLTQRVQRVDLGSLSWSYESSNNVFYAPFGTARSTSVYGYDCYTSKYNKASATALWNGTAVGISVCPSAISSTPRIYVRDTAFSSADAFRSAVSGMYLYYELTTTITHNITDMPSIQEQANNYMIANYRTPVVSANVATNFYANLPDGVDSTWDCTVSFAAPVNTASYNARIFGFITSDGKLRVNILTNVEQRYYLNAVFVKKTLSTSIDMTT